MGESPTYGVKTRYWRTTIMATFDDAFKLEELPHARNPSYVDPQGMQRTYSMSGRSLGGVQTSFAALFLQAHEQALVLERPHDDKNSHEVFLWLSADEFKELEKPKSAPVLEEWICQLEYDYEIPHAQ